MQKTHSIVILIQRDTKGEINRYYKMRWKQWNPIDRELQIIQIWNSLIACIIEWWCHPNHTRWTTQSLDPSLEGYFVVKLFQVGTKKMVYKLHHVFHYRNLTRLTRLDWSYCLFFISEGMIAGIKSVDKITIKRRLSSTKTKSCDQINSRCLCCYGLTVAQTNKIKSFCRVHRITCSSSLERVLCHSEHHVV